MGAGALTGTELCGEEDPAFGFPGFPQPAAAASNVSEMPAAEIPIAALGIFLAEFMKGKRIGFGVFAALSAEASLTCPGRRGAGIPGRSCVHTDIHYGKGMMVNEAGAETGGPNRTPRSEIRPAVSANRAKEPVLLLDLSTSMNWGAADEYGPEWPDTGSRRAIVIEALHGLVRVLEREDSEAAAEQAGGSDELGGLMTHGFANRHVEIGDLNSSNLERRLNQIKWGGKTYIMPAWKAALADYDEEFGDRDPDEQPTMLTLVVTDGEVMASQI